MDAVAKGASKFTLMRIMRIDLNFVSVVLICFYLPSMVGMAGFTHGRRSFLFGSFCPMAVFAGNPSVFVRAS